MPSSELGRLGELGRGVQVGEGRPRGRTRRRGITARPRPRVPRALLAALAVAVAAVVYVNLSAGDQLDDFAHQPPAPASAADLDAGERGSGDARRDETRADRGGGREVRTFATFDDVELVLATPGAEVAFLESSRGTAHPLVPIGELAANANPEKFTPGEDTAGPRYHVLPTVGQPWPATSSAALLLEPGDPVHAPVDGEVVEVARYPMSGGHVDVRVRIALDDGDLAAELRHLSAVEVRVGDRVEAGRTVLGLPREHLPRHPADAVAGEDGVPLLLEVRPARDAGPPDPNMPAEEPGG